MREPPGSPLILRVIPDRPSGRRRLISILPSPDFDISVSGASSVLNSIDSSFGLTWNQLPANATSQVSPAPWQSNKLILSDGAKAYLANATVPTPIPGVFSTSAVLPDATSQAFFYRWAQFNLTGRGGFLPVIGAHVSAYYAYTTSQANNATANALNALSTSNPVIWGYVQYWDAQHGYAQYGYSNDNGVASILLASSNITLPTLPGRLLPGRLPYRHLRPRGGRREPMVQLDGKSLPHGSCPTCERSRRTGLRAHPAV